MPAPPSRDTLVPMRRYTAPQLARRFGCTERAIRQRAARAGIVPTLDGLAHLYTAAQAKKLGPCKRGRPRGAKP